MGVGRSWGAEARGVCASWVQREEGGEGDDYLARVRGREDGAAVRHDEAGKVLAAARPGRWEW